MKKIAFFVILWSFNLLGQQNLVLKKGGISGHLKVPEYEESTFTVFLPTTFDLSKNWPVLIGFDADRDPARLSSVLRTSAEKLGYIVIVSNYAKKNNVQDRILYVSDFLNHINTLLPLDQRRLYTVGYNEDAVLPSALPVVFRQIDGVLALGESFDYFRIEKIRKNFYFAGIVNNKSHTYLSLKNIRSFLKSKAIPAELYEYTNPVSTPPDEKTITKALTSFEIKNMVKGRIPKDSLWIYKQYHKNLEEVEMSLKNKEYLWAFQELKRMQRTFRYVMDIKELKEKQKSISRIPEFRKDKRQYNNYLNQESLLRNEFASAIKEDLTRYRFENLGWWKYQIREINKWQKSDKKYEMIMAVRLKAYIMSLLKSYQTQMAGSNIATLDQKLFLNVLETVVDPKNYKAYKEVISLSARDRDYQTALFYLEEMLKNGYKDLESLYAIEGTLALKISTAYNDVIKRYLGSSKYYQFQKD